jgi:hypothetical protein
MRLLPQNKDIGWTPYAWLIYLTSVPFFGYVTGHTTARFWVPTIAGMVIFLGLYFWGYWIQGKKLLWIITAITLLGMISAPTISSMPLPLWPPRGILDSQYASCPWLLSLLDWKLLSFIYHRISGFRPRCFPS